MRLQVCSVLVWSVSRVSAPYVIAGSTHELNDRVVLRQVDHVHRVEDVHVDIHRLYSHMRLYRCHGRLRLDLEST